jgi:serine acetyltransferase
VATWILVLAQKSWEMFEFGDHAKIGANAVVTKNVATQITAVGAN